MGAATSLTSQRLNWVPGVHRRPGVMHICSSQFSALIIFSDCSPPETVSISIICHCPQTIALPLCKTPSAPAQNKCEHSFWFYFNDKRKEHHHDFQNQVCQPGSLILQLLRSLGLEESLAIQYIQDKISTEA